MNTKLSLFPEGSCVNSSGHLVIGGCDAVELAAQFGTPLYVFDELTLRRQCRAFKTEFGRRYADTSVLYASKAFLNRAIASIIKEEGLGLDVVSSGELSIAASVDFPMDAVYFHGNNKSAEELKLALKHRIGCIVVDNFDELKLLARLAEETGHIKDILLRITPGVDPHTHSHITTGSTGSKFGFPLLAAGEAVAQAMSAASLNLTGLHFHIGSQIAEAEPYLEAVDIVLDFAANMRQAHGFELEELNIGGGYGVQYTLDAPATPVSVFAAAVIPALMKKCRALDMPLPCLTIEPGRAIVARAGVALYGVGAIKEVAGQKRYVCVDGGMADNIRPALYGARYEAVVAGRMEAEETLTADIAGKFCESGDILIKDASLPPVSAGDIIAMPVCGAYSLPMASNYNASLKPAIVMVREGVSRLIRRREALSDLTRNDLL
jgi:diaminopimelate decarboxylase